MENDSERKVDGWVEERLASVIPPADWAPDEASGLEHFRRGRKKRARRNRAWAWGAAVAVTFCAGALMFPATRVVAQRCMDACFGNGRAQSTGPALAGGVAPEFSLLDASGRQVHLADFHGQVVLLNFWATWCGPCKAEIPWFVRLQQEFGSAGLAVVGIAMDDDGWTSVKPYVDQAQINYRIVAGNDTVAQDYGGVEALPTTFVIGRDGRIAATHQGLTPQSTYEKEIRDLLGEK